MEKRRTHILVECPEKIASVKVGVLDALHPLEETAAIVRFRETRNIRPEDICWADMLVCVRGCEEMTLWIVREAKRHGRFVVYFLDDDLLHLPEDTQAYAFFHDGGNAEYLREILALSDALWGVNPLICEEYLPLCGKPRWICSRVPAHIAARAEKPEDGTVHVLYAGSEDHSALVRELILPAVHLVREKRPDIVFTFVGADPGVRGEKGVRHVPFFSDYAAYRRFVEDGHFVLALAPVRLSRFYQCKYYNKFVEYTSIGAVGLYSDGPLYRQIVTDGENGFLCENTPEAWANAILCAAEDPQRLADILHRSEAVLRGQFDEKTVAEELTAQLPELLTYYAPQLPRGFFRLPNARLVFYRGRAAFLFRTYGVLAIPIMLWKAVKKVCHFVFGRRDSSV